MNTLLAMFFSCIDTLRIQYSPARTLRNGFTLIEMVVSLALMGLLLGGSIVGYRKFNERQLVIQSGKELVSVMRLAQKRAGVGDKPDVAGCDGGEKLDGYRIAGTQDTNTYTLSPLCDGSEVAAARTTYTLPTGIVFKQNMDVRFLVLSRGVELTSGATQTFEVGSDQAPGYKYGVRVSRSGEIYEIGIAAL